MSHNVSKGFVQRMLAQDRAGTGVSDDGNTLYGYAAVFGQRSRIVDDTGYAFDEVFAKGAFRKTLRERRDQIQPLFNHGTDPSIGKKPLGVFRTLREDDVGLYYEVELADTTYNADLKALVAQGALRGQSVQMMVTRDAWSQAEGTEVRTVKEAMLADLGPVTFPAYAGTTAALREANLDAEITSEDAGDDATSSDADLTSEWQGDIAAMDAALQDARERFWPTEHRYREEVTR